MSEKSSVRKEHRTKRACQVCDKPFYGSKDYHYCPACARERKLDTVVRIRICQDCGDEFFGGPRARRCPDCAATARRETDRDYRQEGAKRPLGSIDRCVFCGKEYIVTSGRQKYCSPGCQRKGLLAWQREHKRGYYKNSDQAAKKQARREAQEKICIYCLRKFKSDKPTNLCSDYCRSEHRRLQQCIADIKRGHNRDIKKYENRQKQYREKWGEERWAN